MKKLSFLFLAIVAFSCNSPEPSTTDAIKDSSSATVNFPYSIEHPDNWEMNSNANTLIALKSIKAWEEKKIDEAVSYFADSVRLQFDGLDTKMSNDSLKAFFDAGWKNYKNIQLKMEDWESVVSKDKSEEWVTLWYKQIWETTAGVKDSIAMINDLQFKNGKVIKLTEYTRKLH